MPLGHPCLFPFFFFSSFFLSLLSFTAFPFLFVLSFFVRLLYRLLRFFYASLLSLVADSVLLSRCYILPALLASLQVCVFPLCVVFFLFLRCWFLFFYFYSLPSLFFYFDLDVVCFILSCSCGYYLCCLLGFGFCCVCVLHIKPVFLPVDIQHTQCPCRFFLLQRYKQALWSQSHDTEILHSNAVTMQWPAIVLDTTGRTYKMPAIQMR